MMYNAVLHIKNRPGGSQEVIAKEKLPGVFETEAAAIAALTVALREQYGDDIVVKTNGTQVWVEPNRIGENIDGIVEALPDPWVMITKEIEWYTG